MAVPLVKKGTNTLTWKRVVQACEHLPQFVIQARSYSTAACVPFRYDYGKTLGRQHMQLRRPQLLLAKALQCQFPLVR